MASCFLHSRSSAPGAGQARRSFTGQKVRSFTDTQAITSIADSATTLWEGTPHGLVKWDLASGHYTVLGARDGLPDDRIAAVAVDGQGVVWVATKKGVARATRSGWQTFAPAPVGDFITGLQPSVDGRTVWAGGPEGLGRLRNGKWERYLPDVAVTTIAIAPNGVVWVGTSGRGVLRIPRSNDRVELYGAPQGCEADVVRGLVASDHNVFVIGDGPAGPRAAFFDGDRFFSYTIQSPQTLEWTARFSDHLYVGGGDSVAELTVASVSAELPRPAPVGPVKLQAVPPAIARPARSVALKPELPSSALDEPANESPASGKPPRAPVLETVAAPFHVPDGVTAVGTSSHGLLLGTRFLGAMRVENDVPRSFRTNDLSAGAERITVACKSPDECFLATGGVRAWRFDGQTFEGAVVDPEPGSRVLATLRNGKGEVLAIHRGPVESKAANLLRISMVESGQWTPVSMQEVAVPNGPPSLNFAQFSPDGHLWVGLRYVDRENDPIDHGAAEVDLDSGKVIYHRAVASPDAKTLYGFALPSDMVAMYWRGPKEAWFATRSGAARLLDGKVKVFTENEGLESELIQGIDAGPQNEVWVATHRGTGRFDGTRWLFPKIGPLFHKSSALAHDAHGNTFIGTDKGIFCIGDCEPEPIDSRRGLLDDAVLDMTVDLRGRVWVLTSKGISIVEP
jgi:hypothetical protein